MTSALRILGLWGGGTALAILCYWLLAGVVTGQRAPATSAASAPVASANSQATIVAPSPAVAAATAAATEVPTVAPTAVPTAPQTVGPTPTPVAAPTPVPTTPPPTAAPTLAAAKPAPTATQAPPSQPTAAYGAPEQPMPEQLAASPSAYVGHRVIVNGAVDRCVQEAGRFVCWIQVPSTTSGRAYYVGVEFVSAHEGVQPGVGLAVTGTVIGTAKAPEAANGPPAAFVRAEQFAVGN